MHEFFYATVLPGINARIWYQLPMSPSLVSCCCELWWGLTVPCCDATEHISLRCPCIEPLWKSSVQILVHAQLKEQKRYDPCAQKLLHKRKKLREKLMESCLTGFKSYRRRGKPTFTRLRCTPHP